ncbi:hypothetical protein T07_9929 [Trichinella nelsoni]|uniref:Uncharacterized protein n=1 Tax=Trichinella nelsoni TaxID=6336 RepID=A0A0V0SJT2_9BILA|nr:hypothetical protein T07_9929 [Trichinella nelsoni]
MAAACAVANTTFRYSTLQYTVVFFTTLLRNPTTNYTIRVSNNLLCGHFRFTSCVKCSHVIHMLQMVKGGLEWNFS